MQDATLTIGRDKREFIELDKNNLLLEEASYDNTPRQRIGYNETLRKTFKDGRVAFTEEQVKAETARCLGCGASEQVHRLRRLHDEVRVRRHPPAPRETGVQQDVRL